MALAGRRKSFLGRFWLPSLLLAMPWACTLSAGAQSSSTASLPTAPAPAQNPDGGSTGGGFPVTLPSQNSLANPYLGSVQAQTVVSHVIQLSLADAYRMGIANNLGLILTKQNEETYHAQKLQTLNVLLPNVDVNGSLGFHQFNLQADGFSKSLLGQLGPVFANLSPGTSLSSFPLIVNVTTTQGQATLSQYLFDWAGYDLVKALDHQVRSTEESSASSRGQVVQNVGVAYLRVVAAKSQVAFDQSLLKTDASVLYQSQQKHEAGVGTRLDELRSRVQYQSEEQALIADQVTLSKAKIALNRSIGLPPEQEIDVTEEEPFAALEGMSPQDAIGEALRARQDYQAALEQVKAGEMETKAATRERFPTLKFNGDYGVQGLSGGVYHGVWAATGTLNIPVFQEAQFRSDHDTAVFTLQQAQAQANNLREQIAQQVRVNLIDLAAAKVSEDVAKSNVALGQVALEQSIERFHAGVEDDLPSTEAQSTLAQAQVQLVNATFDYNQAKINLARDLGMLDVQFHPEWQGGHPASLRNVAAYAPHP